MDALLKNSSNISFRQTILLVDQHSGNLEHLHSVLDNGHLILRRAGSGTEAMEMLLQHEASLILMDVDMPDMSGYDLAQLIRGNRKTRSIPIIFISDKEYDEAASLRGYRAGAIDYLAKPINSLILHSKVAVFLELDQSRRRLQSAYSSLDSTKAYYESILNAAGEGMLGIDCDGKIRFANPAALHMLGCSNDELIGKDFHAFYPASEDEDLDWRSTPFFQCCQAGLEIRIDDACFHRSGGENFPVSLCCSAMAGQTEGIVVVFQDISGNKRLREQLRRQEVTDHLTELANRNGFKAELQSTLERAKRNHKSVAVMFIDLDHFKRINDTLGHEVGDHLLQSVAMRLKECVRSYDLVSRIGGDEFTVVLGELDESAGSAIIARKILASLRRPFSLKEGTRITVGASIGISSFPECGSDVDVLMQAADVAMYHAKSEGRNSYQFYLPEMNAKAKSRLVLEQALRSAVEDDEFSLKYQPQIDLGSGRVVGFEALLRWQHEHIGTVSPSTFVPMLEETGLIVPIGQWVFSTGCRQRQLWKSMLPEQCSLSVNLSPRQFTDKNLIEVIRHVLEINELPAYQLEIELTESMLMQDTVYTQELLHSLKKMGVKLSVDDFGTGYSSLAYLKQFELDALKIDKQFIDNLTISRKDAAIATSIIQLAHNLGLQVVAEGVETIEQVGLLQELGCDVVQGYYFGAPITATEVERFPHEIIVH